MSVLINGMDAPKSCLAGNGCEFRHICEPYKVALARPALMSDGEWIETAKKIVGEMCEKRLKACPLVEVSTPHGRLIDADKMVEKYHVGSFDIAKVAKAMPTVIEAEEE